jgi:hypothetical protein
MLIDLPDALRQLAVVLVTQAWVKIRSDPTFDNEAQECEALLRALSRPLDDTPWELALEVRRESG